jgi:hypothetical protein
MSLDNISDARADGKAHRKGLSTVDITEVVLTRVGDPPDHLVIEAWHEGKGRPGYLR